MSTTPARHDRLRPLRQQVARLRAVHGPGLPLATAVTMARAESAEPPAPYGFLADLPETTKVSAVINGFTITVWIEDDPDHHVGDDDVTGRFTDTHEDGCVPNTLGHSQDLTWYRPSNLTLRDGYTGLRRAGMSKAAARDAYHHLVQREMSQDAHRCYVGIVATIALGDDELARDSLWGIDVLPGVPGSRAYLLDLATECVQQVLTQAAQKLPSHIAGLRARLAAAQLHTPASETAVLALPDGELRIYAADPADDDPSHLYVLDVLGVAVSVYIRHDDTTRVHVDDPEQSHPSSRPLVVGVYNNDPAIYDLSAETDLRD